MNNELNVKGFSAVSEKEMKKINGGWKKVVFGPMQGPKGEPGIGIKIWF